MKKSGGSVVLETYGEIALAPYVKQELGTAVVATPEVITTALKDLFKESHITAKDFIVSLPSPATLIFLLNLPKVYESNLHAIISNEARKFIPIPLSEVALDYIILPSRQTYADESAGIESTIEVLVVAVRSDTLLVYENIITTAQLSPYELEVEAFSVIRSGFRHEITPTMIIDMGAKTTRICIVEYGTIRIFHVINRGSIFITEVLARSLNISFEKAEELKRTYYKHDSANLELITKTIQDAYAYIIAETDAVLLQYQRNNQKIVQKIILSGGGVLLHGFSDYVTDHFKVPTELIKSFDKSQTPEFLTPVLMETSPTFAVSAGLALKKFL